MTRVRDKYNRLAEGFAEDSYANLEFYMRHRLNLVKRWGSPLHQGDSILELGCGDGYLAQLFAESGFQYWGMDISPRMVGAAERRLQGSGLSARFLVSDVNEVSLPGSYDAVVSFMRTFFSYVRDPMTTLGALRHYVRKKLVIDLDPRHDCSIQKAIRIMEGTGFRNVVWRPFFVPQGRRLPLWLLKALIGCEGIPVVRSLPLGWKFHCLLKGEP